MSETLLRDSLLDSGIPAHMHDGIMLYVLHGYSPGHFLTAVLENNLTEAVGRADDANQRALVAYVRWFYNEAPSPCWGSPKKVSEWMESRQAERAKGGSR